MLRATLALALIAVAARGDGVRHAIVVAGHLRSANDTIENIIKADSAPALIFE